MKKFVEDDFKQFEQRKQDHIDLALQNHNQCINNDIDSLVLIHEALPDLNFNDVDISQISLNQCIPSPFFVSSMTAGHKDSVNINLVLAEASAHKHWAMGVGSQRRELSDKQAGTEWQKIRKTFPAIQLYGNIGIAQVITHSCDDIQRLCENLQAAALFIHCNPLQEAIQPEGTPEFSGCYNAIEALCSKLDLPVIIKETGCGFSLPTLQRLNNCGIAAVDVSGKGGTHWGRIEGHRAQLDTHKQTAASFQSWGISTLQAILNARQNATEGNFEYWASGGIRSGLDAAKYLALGAKRVGIAKPLLEAALKGTEKVIQQMETFEYELKTAMFCTGSQNLSQLTEAKRWQLMI